MKNTTIFKRLLGYLKAYRLRLFFVLLSAVISTAFMVLAPFLVGKVTTTLFASIADKVFYWETIIWLLAALVALYFVSQLFSFLQGFGMAKITANVMQTIRREIDEKMHRLKLNYYDVHTHGDILSVITNDVDTINNTISQNLTSIVTQVTTAIGVLIMMLMISPKLSLIPIVMVPLSLLSAAGVMKASEKYYGEQQELLGKLNGYVEEMYNGQSVVQTFNYQERAKKKFSQLNDALKNSSRKAETTAGAISPITEEGYGAAKIANMLNEKGYKTKRNCKWSQNATCRILTNEIYTGKIINGKQEVSDFLTGQRRDKDETEWMVVERPELRIIEDETFEKAQEILRGRHDAFNLSHERQSNKHLFSTLIKCKECGWSFRRTVRTYKNTYVRWVCSGRNGRGVDSCPNKMVVDEEELIEVLQEYFTNVLKQKKKVIAHVVNEFQRVYKAKDENVEYEKELNAELAKLQKTRQKYMDMYTDDLISREELNEKIGGSRQEMERIENELKMVSYHLTKGEQLENILNNTFKEIEDITDVHQMTNQQLKRLIQKIEVDKEGNVDIYLRLLGDLGLDESVLIEENETVLNCDDQT